MWCMYWISEVMCWAVREEQTVSALSLTSRFSHKTNNCKALSLNGSSCLGQLGWCSSRGSVCVGKNSSEDKKQNKAERKTIDVFVLCQSHC